MLILKFQEAIRNISVQFSNEFSIPRYLNCLMPHIQNYQEVVFIDSKKYVNLHLRNFLEFSKVSHLFDAMIWVFKKVTSSTCIQNYQTLCFFQFQESRKVLHLRNYLCCYLATIHCSLILTQHLHIAFYCAVTIRKI